jgi:hypothetical protein
MDDSTLSNTATALRQLKTSSDHSDRVFYLDYVNRIGRIGKRLYELNPDPKLKQSLFKLYDQIKDYPVEREIPPVMDESESIAREVFGS